MMVVTGQSAFDSFASGLLVWVALYGAHRWFREGEAYVSHRPLWLLVLLCGNPRGDGSLNRVIAGAQLVMYVFMVGYPLAYVAKLSEFLLTSVLTGLILLLLLAFFLMPSDKRT